MSKLLITGGAGFIGSNFVHYWRDSNPDDSMIVLDAQFPVGMFQSFQIILSRSKQRLSVKFVLFHNFEINKLL